jgi:hypothetical protein
MISSCDGVSNIAKKPRGYHLTQDYRDTNVTTYLVVFALHMLGAEHQTYNVQVMKFNDISECQKARPLDDGIASVCTTKRNDGTGFVAAMNCGRGVSTIVAGRQVLAFTCPPSMSIPK